MREHRVLPVLHLVDSRQVKEQAALAYDAGADGLFLIDMGQSQLTTAQAVMVVREDYPVAWLGVNVLGYDIPDALRYVSEWPIQGLWVDHSGIDERPLSWQVIPTIHRALFDSPDIEVFGGVSFKYGREVPIHQLRLATEVASVVLPVVTTSGPGTGRPADTNRLRIMREGLLNNARLAVASGVTPENAPAMFEHVNDVLLATGIESAFGYFDRQALRRVIAAR